MTDISPTQTIVSPLRELTNSKLGSTPDVFERLLATLRQDIQDVPPQVKPPMHLGKEGIHGSVKSEDVLPTVLLAPEEYTAAFPKRNSLMYPKGILIDAEQLFRVDIENIRLPVMLSRDLQAVPPQEGTTLLQDDQTVMLPTIEAEYGSARNFVVRDEDVVLKHLSSSDEHADSFTKIGIFGHQKNDMTEEIQLFRAGADSISKAKINPVPVLDYGTSLKQLVDIDVAELNIVLEDAPQTTNKRGNTYSSIPVVKNVNIQTKSSSKIGVSPTHDADKDGNLSVKYKVDVSNFEVEGLNAEPLGGETEIQDAERQARTSSVYRAVAQMPNSQVHIALYAIERGLRLFARVSDLSNGERSELRGKINTVLAQYGMSGAEVIIENYSNQSLNERTK